MIRFVRDVLRVLRMPCREQNALFSKHLDEPLSPGLFAGLRIHILYCSGCKKYRAQIQKLRDLAQRIGQDLASGESMPAALRSRVLGRAADKSKKN